MEAQEFIASSTPPRIFISYARSDGEEYARNLRRRLVEEYGFSVWQDRAEMEGGKNWWQQIVEALKNEYIEYMVLVMTPAAMGSDTVRREWRLARQEGVCVLPVIAAPDLDFKNLPPWMSAPHFVNPAIPEQWTRFIRTLESPCNEQRVAFMVEDLPEDFVMRSREFDQLITNLLNKQQEEPVALTAALRGAGGYGKTVLAKAICHDERIQEEFFDGILWITLGENPGDLTKDVEDLIYVLSGERPGFANIETAITWFVKLLDERHILMVIDDVWNAAHLKPFLEGGLQCARLITTRNLDTLPSNAKKINVDAMQQNEATSLIEAGLPQGNEDELRKLASRLGEWPLLLKLVNGTLRHRVQDNNQELPDALVYVNKALDKRGLTFFDARDAASRDQAVEKTLGVSMELLNPDECARYGELAIFPEDTNVPLATLEKLWNTTGVLDEFDTEVLCDRFMRLSLLLNFDLTSRHIRLHDVVRQYLIQKQSNKMPLLHNQLLEAYCHSDQNTSKLAELPVDEPYIWNNLAYHMAEARRCKDLQSLLFNFEWMQAKLDATDLTSLISDYDYLSVDYDYFPDDSNLQLVQSAIRLSAHVLIHDKEQLAAQLLGRLLSSQEDNIQSMLEHVRKSKRGKWLRPLTACLRPAGSALIRTIEGHTNVVTAVAVTPDGRRLISASYDKTLKIWDLECGEHLKTLKGHSAWVTAVTVTPDNKRIISASDDQTSIIWDLESGEQLKILRDHTGSIKAVAVTPDGQRVITASYDRTLNIWDIESGEILQTLKDHTDSVNVVAVTPDGQRIVSGSDDKTIKIWNMKSGELLKTLHAHNKSINAVSVTSDGCYIISGSDDKTIKIWDIESGKRRNTLKEQYFLFTAVALTSDDQHAVSGSDDGTLRVWNIKSGDCITKLPAHDKSINAVAVTSDGRRAISASNDNTLKIWDIKSGERLQMLKAHSKSINVVVVTPDGEHGISASDDGTVKVWNPKNGEQLRTLGGNNNSVTAIAVTPNSRCVISASKDNTIRVWDLGSGEQLQILEGYNTTVINMDVTLDGLHAISSSDDHILKVWNLKSGESLQTFEGDFATFSSQYFKIPDRPIRYLIVTPDGQYLISTQNAVIIPFTVKKWNIETGEILRTFVGDFATLSPDGRYLISVSFDKILIWDMETAELLHILKGHTGVTWIDYVVVTPDGRRLISVSNGKILIWDMETAELLHILKGPIVTWKNCVVVTPDGRRLIYASYGKIVIWDIKTEEQIYTLQVQSEVITLKVMPDNQHVIIVSEDKTLKILDMYTERVIAVFHGDEVLETCAISPDGHTIFAGDASGMVYILRLEGMGK